MTPFAQGTIVIKIALAIVQEDLKKELKIIIAETKYHICYVI